MSETYVGPILRAVVGEDGSIDTRAIDFALAFHPEEEWRDPWRIRVEFVRQPSLAEVHAACKEMAERYEANPRVESITVEVTRTFFGPGDSAESR